ncbi:sigma 54-interacting transcriptional regulator [Myxococcota bacterium]|nr:sigma 54-interacting transcriptional regulator [Myxococcota bacterium]
MLEQALAAMRGVVPYDLAAVFRLRDQELRVVAAAGPLDGPAIRRHRLRLDRFPTIRRALQTRQPIPLEAHDHAGAEGDPYDGVLDLPDGHSCMVVPLFAGDESLGLITLDRTQCAVYPPEAVQLAAVYGQLVSMALRFADQAALLDRYRHQLEAQNRILMQEAGGADLACSRLEASTAPAMRALARQARQVAGSDLPVLVLGETGTGKELVAQAIHHWSPRADGPFVKLNCAALPEGLVESELFGHVKGAFSGAARDRAGRFLTANGGTLLLDEVGDLPLSAQAKLLRVLQEGTFEPVGADRGYKVDVRVVAATHVDLLRAVAEGRFREDLYYRLAVFPLRLLPLRERVEEIVPIALDLLEEQARRRGAGPWTLSAAAIEALRSAPWPGNVRELRNALERATILQPRGPLEPVHLGLASDALAAPGAVGARGQGGPASIKGQQPAPGGPGGVGAGARAPGSFEDNERRYLEALLGWTGGRLYGPDGAAAIAGMPPSTLRSRMVKLGLR